MSDNARESNWNESLMRLVLSATIQATFFNQMLKTVLSRIDVRKYKNNMLVEMPGRVVNSYMISLTNKNTSMSEYYYKELEKLVAISNKYKSKFSVFN